MSKSNRKKQDNGTSISEEGDYAFENIINKRRRKGTNEYLVKWVGYPESANTWEPETNLNWGNYFWM